MHFHPGICLCKRAVRSAQIAMGKGEETAKPFSRHAGIGDWCPDVQLLDSLITECVFRVVNNTL